MPEEISIDSLRAAIRKRQDPGQPDQTARFEAVARRYEAAVRHLVNEIHGLVSQVPELTAALEEETEVFTSPAFPGLETRIADQRLRVTLGEDFLLFDPTAKALLGAMGQVEVHSSRPIPFLVEKVLYLIPDAAATGGARWGYRSVDNLGRELMPLTRQGVLRMLQALFA